MPASQAGYGVCPSYTIDDGSISLTTENIVRNYDTEGAQVSIKAENGNALVVQLHPERPTVAFLSMSSGRFPRTAAQFRSAFSVDLVVVPTLSPFEAKEKWVTEQTARANETTRLSSRSFRNIWFRKNHVEMSKFNSMVQGAWPGVTLFHPIVSGPERTLELNYLEDGETREIYWAGFGFQVWLQMMTHVMKGSSNSILVLDEPDIYLHPSLQRRLIKVIRDAFGQMFIATHSTEIINEVNAGDVLLVDSRTKSARRISSESAYRHLFTHLGSSENADFARMARARRVVFFEGDDRRLLRRFAEKASKARILGDPDTVFLKAGGFGQWRRVNEVGWTLENVFGIKIKIAAIFDSDYRCQDEIDEFKQNFDNPDLLCHCFERKEIENYALQEAPLIRTMEKRAGSNGRLISVKRCQQIIDEIFVALHNDVRAHIVGDYIRHHKRKESRLNEATLISRAMSVFEPAWADRVRRFSLVGGKDFLSILSTRLTNEVGKSITMAQIVQEMTVSEIPKELINLIGSIEDFFAGI